MQRSTAQRRFPVVTGIVLAVSAPAASAAVINANAADATYSSPRTDGATFDAGLGGIGTVVLQNSSTTDTTLQVGATSSNSAIATAIIPFQLPTLLPGESFSDVSFSIGQSTASNGNQVDLYGLGRRSAAAVQPADHYRGTTGGDTTDATLIQGAFVASTDSFAVNAVTSTSLAGSAALTSYLNTQYANGAGAGQFVFLRLNVTDAFTASNTRLNPMAQNNATVALRPVINYSTIPEPASVGMAGIMTIGLLARRRNRGR